MLQRKERGTTLVIAMLLVLVFLALTISITYDSRSQSTMTGGIKLQQYYETAALSVVNRVRANLADEFVTPDTILASNNKSTWRFGNLLSSNSYDPDANGYGLLFEEGDMAMNAGLLDLQYSVWISNNPDDPAFSMRGVNLADPTQPPIDPTWDLDAKVIMTVEIFSTADTNKTSPLTTRTVMVGLTGADVITRYEEGVREGDDADPGNQGRGSAGRASRIDIEALR